MLKIEKDIHEIANYFGLSKQLFKMQEESGELITSIAKIELEGFANPNLSNLASEIADVEIVLEQIKYLIEQYVHRDIRENIESIKEYKVCRTKERYGI